MDTTAIVKGTTANGNATAPGQITRHRGTCHCGAVHFAVELEDASRGMRCNCTICTKTAATTACVKPEAFAVLAGEANLAFYEFGGKTGRRFFCRTCGIHCFGRGHLKELGGDYVSVNLNALDDIDAGQLQAVYWDGRHNNWYAGTRPTPWPIFDERGAGQSPAAPAGAPAQNAALNAT